MESKEMIKKVELAGLTKVDIASRLGVSGATVFRWAKATKPHKVFLKKLEELLVEIEKRKEVEQNGKNSAL